MRRWPTRYYLILSLSLIVLTAPVAGARRAGPKLLRQCPGGKLYQLGGQRVLLLSGSPYQMGLAHGKLLADDIKAVTRSVLTVARAADAVKEKNFFAGSIERAYKRLAPFIPGRYQQEMRGLAAGAGVGLKDVRLANIFPALFHCSGFAVFGGVTQGGRLLHGRILDYMTQVRLQEYAVTIVARPAGRHAFVNVTYAGFIGSVTGMNDQQVAIGEMGGRGEGRWDGMPMPMLVRKALEDASTLDQALAVFKDNPRTCEYYYVVSDGKIPDARGLYCTPKTFFAIKPGETYDGLLRAVGRDEMPKGAPAPVNDAVVISGDDRLKLLLKRIQDRRGRIDPAAAIKMMLRPVAMKGNLHNVLFAPQSLEFWVAHAAADHTAKNYQACYQPYEHYDMRELMALAPVAAGPRGGEDRPAQANASKPREQMGVVPASAQRPISPEANPAVARHLARFRKKPEAFRWRMKPMKNQAIANVYTVEFPSPHKSPVEANNTVYCEYFRTDDATPAPGVIVLHIADGRFLVARVISHYLARQGINALVLKMPYYGRRRPADKAELRRMTDSPGALVDGAAQAIMDVRRAAAWLATRPEVDPRRIGLCGVSLGGFVAAAAGGVDGAFPRVAIVLAGGDLPAVLMTNAKEARALRRTIEKGNWTRPRLRKLLAPIEPLTYADRLRSSRVLMVNADKDKVVPPACARKLAQACGAEVLWRSADHYSMVMHLPAILDRLVDHFSQPNN